MMVRFVSKHVRLSGCWELVFVKHDPMRAAGWELSQAELHAASVEVARWLEAIGFEGQDSGPPEGHGSKAKAESCPQ